MNDPQPPAGTTAEARLRASDFPCVIPGRGQRRAVIRLKGGATGFADPANPRPLLLIPAWNWTAPCPLAPNVSFNQAAGWARTSA